MLIVGVDCSTTAAKAVVVDGAGRVVGAGSSPLHTTTPRPGWHEQDPETWWTATSLAIASAVQRTGRAAEVTAVCIAHQRESFVCLDERGRPLRAALLWLDGRATREIAELGTPEVEALSGKPADITPALYKLAWLARHEPGTLEGAHRVADVHGFLVHRLTGRWVTSTSSADPLALLDVAARDYAEPLLRLAGVRRDQLLDLEPAGSALGPLRPEAAAACGLPPTAVVVAGLGDGQAAGVGAGVLDAAHGYLNLGTAVLLGTEQHGYRPSRDYRSLVSVVEGNTTLETFLSSGTYLPTWFRRTFGPSDLCGEPDPALEAAAAALPPGSDRLVTLPFWNAAQTPHWDPRASGAMVGWRSQHGPAHMYRSLLEGVAFELHGQLAGLERGTGQHLRVLRAMGGGTRSTLWRQIMADVLERPLELCTAPEISALGAAVVAAAALGVHPSLPAAAEAMTATGAVVDPDPRASARYAELREVHHALYPVLAPLLHRLAASGGADPVHADPVTRDPGSAPS